LNADLENYRK